MKTGSSALLEALVEARVSHIFANLGSDHSGLMEAIAEATALERPIPRLIICPTEMVALSAAHGFAQVSGIAQAVIVHVECGTQSLAGGVHNAAKGRVPVLLFAGTSPSTQRGELKGSRNEFIQWIQDVFDQRGLVRGYAKYNNEIRNAENIKELVHRALRFAYSDPKGPVYLMAAREVLEATVPSRPEEPDGWYPIEPSALTVESARKIATDLINARRPILVTSYLGRNPQAVAELVALCERVGMGVLESVPSYANFPHSNPLYLGNQWNEPHQNSNLAEADLVLVIDSDVPWIPLLNKPRDDAQIYHIDIDPLKLQMPISVMSRGRAYLADALTALQQINGQLETLDERRDPLADRRAHYSKLHVEREASLRRKERGAGDTITPEYLTACIRDKLDMDTLVVSEGVSNYQVITDHLHIDRPGALIASGGGSLGWNGGAAIGAKLAAPEKTVVALTGDGSYMMSIPSSVHWMSRRYRTPFLQVIYNNGGWKSPKLSTLAIHPKGYAERAADFLGAFPEAPDYASIAAAAGGAFARSIRHPAQLQTALEEGLHAVRVEERSAVLDVHLPPL
jgi:acetolactate synthase-1/2/3 large subunit